MLNENYHRKYCVQCSKEIRGRADKKFCNEICRNQFHNKQKAPVNNLVRNINSVLGRNRGILEELLRTTDLKARVPIELLSRKGFRFTYFTHIKTTKKGEPGYYCYDLGYTLVSEDYCRILYEPLLE